MNSKKVIGILTSLALAFALLLVGVTSTPAQPTQAESVVGVRSVTLLNSTSGGFVNGDASYTAFYGIADCFSTWQGGVSVAGAPPTTTVVLQHSPDASVWVTDTQAFYAAQSSASTLFTRTTLYGSYVRASINAANSNAVSITVKCTLKNTQQ